MTSIEATDVAKNEHPLALSSSPPEPAIRMPRFLCPISPKLSKFAFIYEGIDLNRIDIRPRKDSIASEDLIPSNSFLFVLRILNSSSVPHFLEKIESAGVSSVQPNENNDHLVLNSASNFRARIRVIVAFYVEAITLTDHKQSNASEFIHCIECDVLDVCDAVVRVLQDQTAFEKVTHYMGEKAQQTLDFFQDVLDYCLGKNLSGNRYSKILRAGIQLASNSGKQSSCLALKGVQRTSKYPRASDGLSDIYRGTWNNQIVCLKVLRVHQKSDIDTLLKAFSTKLLIWRNLEHPNVLPLYGSYHIDGQMLCFVSPWMENGNLSQYLQEGGVQLQNRIPLAADLVSGLAFIHSQEIVHGDLTGASVLVTDLGRACISGFGLSTVMQSTVPHITANMANTGDPLTPRWMSPERFLDNPLSYSSDVYSLGCVLYEIFSGRVPFFELSTAAAVVLSVMKGGRPQRPGDDLGMNNFIWKIIEDCWRQKPADRPTVEEVMRRMQDEVPLAFKPSDNWDRSILHQDDPLCPTVVDIQRILESKI